MEDLIIRPATLDDLGVLLQFEQELIKTERPLDVTIQPPPVHYYDLEDFIRDEGVALLVAESGGRVVSCGYACSKKARPYLDHTYYAYLGFMYTLPEYRGKGVNLKIIEHLKQWAAGNGYREIRLTVYHNNYPAIRAYEKAGFESHILEMRLAVT